jgi:ClpA/ClpB-like protein
MMNWLKSFLSGFTTPLSSEKEMAASYDDFTPHAQRLLALARKEADRTNHNFVGTEHLLLGIVEGEGVAVNVLLRQGIKLEAVRAEVEKRVGRGPDEKMIASIPYTPRVKGVLALAVQASKSMSHGYLGTEHILLGLLEEGDGVGCRVLKHFNLETKRTRQEILKELDPNFSSDTENAAMKWNKKSAGDKSEDVDITKRYDVYCRDHEREVVYRNALLKGVKTLFKMREYDSFAEFMEIEQADGHTVLVSKHSLSKLCEHGVQPTPEVVYDKREEPAKK